LDERLRRFAQGANLLCDRGGNELIQRHAPTFSSSAAAFFPEFGSFKENVLSPILVTPSEIRLVSAF
jgi:hypothetical protein